MLWKLAAFSTCEYLCFLKRCCLSSIWAEELFLSEHESNVSPSLPSTSFVQELTATLLCKLGPGQSEVAEELCLRLQRKEKMLQELLSDRNRQAMEHDAEIRELLQAMSTKEQWSKVSCVQCSTGDTGADY